MPAGWRPEDEKDRPTEPLEQLGVFAQEPQSHPKADPQPAAGRGVFLDGPPARRHCRRPEQDGEWVNCHQHCAQGEKRRGCYDQEQEKTGPGVDLAREKAEHDETEDGGNDW